MEQLPRNDRALSLEEAVSIALVLQQTEQWAAAADIYRSILEVAPDHPDAMHFSGVLAHQQARSEEAVALIERSLELEPDRADWYSNLGIVLQDRLKLDEAIVAYQRAIALDPNHANAHNNLGVVLRAKGKVVEAEAAYRVAIRIDPEHSDAYNNLGVLLNAQKRPHEAAVCFSKVITLRPKDPEARRLLALAYCTLGEVDKAVEVFEEWLKEEPDNPIARHMLAACSGRDVPARASDAFIERTFDSFAASFDAKLAKLSYRAPALVAEMLTEWDVEASKSLDVLDAGCGTGLCGPLVAQYARRLVGVDLSERMIAQARARNVYDELVKRELTAYLGDSAGAFDVIVSADTVVYFGPLEGVVAAYANALRPGGRLIFTVEEMTGGESDAGYSISPNGRYRHTREYLERVLANANLRSEIVAAELRLEAGDPVPGLVVRGTKPMGVAHGSLEPSQAGSRARRAAPPAAALGTAASSSSPEDRSISRFRGPPPSPQCARTVTSATLEILPSCHTAASDVLFPLDPRSDCLVQSQRTLFSLSRRKVMSVNKHPYKVSLRETESSPGIPERGWLNMDVRWLITKDNVGASTTVFGVTYFPPGSRHEIHRHPNVEEVEYLISGSGIAYVEDDAVELGPGEAVFVPQNAYHGFENNSDAEVVMAWCYAGAASLEDAGFVTQREDEEAAG